VLTKIVSMIRQRPGLSVFLVAVLIRSVVTLATPFGGCNETVDAYHFNWLDDDSDARFQIRTDPIDR